MPGINLTRVEASERACHHHYSRVRRRPGSTQGEETFRSVTVARLTPSRGEHLY